ncbi:putative phage-associated protein [Bacteroidales bacterium Barb6XT]|nr:putative phage-associated protein [Bacteroidales bacterium Barb6XT]
MAILLQLTDQPSSVFNLDKSLQTVLYVANKLDRKDFHKIFKVLYFADMEHLSDYGRSITGDTYIAMENGPVPSKIYSIFQTVRGDGSQTKGRDLFIQLFTVKDNYFIEPLRKADTSVLSGSDTEALDNALTKYGNLSWVDIRDKSHGHAWNATERNKAISIEDILQEKGDDAGYISYVVEQTKLTKSLA